jgi:uncharacterized protein (DUF3084 family)
LHLQSKFALMVFLLAQHASEDKTQPLRITSLSCQPNGQTFWWCMRTAAQASAPQKQLVLTKTSNAGPLRFRGAMHGLVPYFVKVVLQ